jgi:hypothetical protein
MTYGNMFFRHDSCFSTQTSPENSMSFRSLSKLLVSLSLFACASVYATPLVIDVGGADSVGLRGNSGNTVLTFNVGAYSTITLIDYTVNLTAFSPSKLSEMHMAFSAPDQHVILDYYLGYSDAHAGTATYSNAAQLIQGSFGLTVNADGILRLEFYQEHDNLPGADGHWNSGTLTFAVQEGPGVGVPEPDSAFLLGAGLALMGYSIRRRRAAIAL